MESFEEWRWRMDRAVADIDRQIDVLKALRDSYALCSYPFHLGSEEKKRLAGMVGERDE